MLWHCQNTLCPTCEVRTVQQVGLPIGRHTQKTVWDLMTESELQKEMHITRGGLVRITLFKLWLVFFISFFNFGILGIGKWENTCYIFQMRYKDASDPLGERNFIGIKISCLLGLESLILARFQKLGVIYKIVSL